jgi:predicted transcriptional regulator
LRKMLLSFRPDVYEKIKSGVKIFEHRRNFPDEPIMAYMYVSSPVKAITGVVYLGKRHCLSDWLEYYKEDSNAVTRIKEYMETYHYRYAMEIDRFQETSQISLDELRENVPGFVAPQMYIYLDGTELLEYIERNVIVYARKIEHKHEEICSQNICRN